MTFKSALMLGLCCTLCAGACAAVNKGLNENAPEAPEWAEEQAAPPPAFSSTQVLPLAMPPHVSLKIGIDPQTLSVGRDGVVRYVVVMRNAGGSVQANYEGLRCSTLEVKTYARWGASGQWNQVAEPAWVDLAARMPSHHAQALARQGACVERQAPEPERILELLKSTQLPVPFPQRSP